MPGISWPINELCPNCNCIMQREWFGYGGIDGEVDWKCPCCGYFRGFEGEK